jgi:hypothetical protein
MRKPKPRAVWLGDFLRSSHCRRRDRRRGSNGSREAAAHRIVDKDGARVRSFTIEGNLAATRDASALAGGAHFDDIDFDFFGNVFAVDSAHHRVHKLRDDLVPLDSFGSK